MIEHIIKILQNYFIDVITGIKTFEVRKNDRDYQVGDTLILHEWNENGYTGNACRCEIVYLLSDANYCKDGYVILGFKIHNFSYGFGKKVGDL